MNARSTRKSLAQIQREKDEQEAYETALASFRRWWEPYSFDERTGASKGGHPNALRLWVKPDGSYRKKWYGVPAELAFGATSYREEWEQWIRNGEPAEEPFTSNALSADRIREELVKLNQIMAMDAFP